MRSKGEEEREREREKILRIDHRMMNPLETIKLPLILSADEHVIAEAETEVIAGLAEFYVRREREGIVSSESASYTIVVNRDMNRGAMRVRVGCRLDKRVQTRRRETTERNRCGSSKY